MLYIHLDTHTSIGRSRPARLYTSRGYNILLIHQEEVYVDQMIIEILLIQQLCRLVN